MTSCKGQGTISVWRTLHHRPGLPRGVNEQCLAACLHLGLFRDCSLNAAGQLQRETEGTPTSPKKKPSLILFTDEQAPSTEKMPFWLHLPVNSAFVSSRRLCLGWCWGPWVWAEGQPGPVLYRQRVYPKELQKGREEPRESKHWTRDRLKRMALSPADLPRFSAHGNSIPSKGHWIRTGGMQKQVLCWGWEE